MLVSEEPMIMRMIEHHLILTLIWSTVMTTMVLAVHLIGLQVIMDMPILKARAIQLILLMTIMME